MGVAGSRCGSAGRFGIEWNPRIGLVGNAVAQVTAHQLDGPQPDDVPQRLGPDLAHCGVVGLPGGWLLLGLWGVAWVGVRTSVGV